MEELKPPKSSTEIMQRLQMLYINPNKNQDRKVSHKKPNPRRSILHERAITKELSKQLAISKKIIEAHKELHDFQSKWEYVDFCKNCNGSGCDKCNQSGIMKKDITNIIKSKPPPEIPINEDCRSGNYPKPNIKQFLKALFK